MRLASHPAFPLSSPMAVDCSVAQFWQSRPRHPSIRNWEILPRFRVRELSNGWGTLYHWVTPWYTAPGEKHSTLPSSSGSIWIDCTNTQSHLWFELSRLQISFAWSSNQIGKQVKKGTVCISANSFPPLIANIFESGPMPTPWKILDKPPLLLSCKLS